MDGNFLPCIQFAVDWGPGRHRRHRRIRGGPISNNSPHCKLPYPSLCPHQQFEEWSYMFVGIGTSFPCFLGPLLFPGQVNFSTILPWIQWIVPDPRGLILRAVGECFVLLQGEPKTPLMSRFWVKVSWPGHPHGLFWWPCHCPFCAGEPVAVHPQLHRQLCVDALLLLPTRRIVHLQGLAAEQCEAVNRHDSLPYHCPPGA